MKYEYEYNELNKKFKALQDERDSYRLQADTAREDYADLYRRFEDRERDNSELTEIANQAQRDKLNAEDALDKVNQYVKELKAELADVKDTKNKLVDEVVGLKNNANALRNEADLLREDRDEWRRRCGTSDKAIQKHVEIRKELELTQTGLMKQVEADGKALEQADEELTKAHRNISDLKDEIEQMANEIAELESGANEDEDTIQELEIQVKELKEDKTELGNEVQRKGKELSDAKIKIKFLEQTCDELTKQVVEDTENAGKYKQLLADLKKALRVAKRYEQIIDLMLDKKENEQ